MEVVFIAIFICIMFVIGTGIFQHEEVQTPHLPITIEIKPIKEPKVIIKEVIKYVDKPTPKVKAAVSPKPSRLPPAPKVDMTAFNEAKKALSQMGYSLDTIKNLLQRVGTCNTAEEYINKVMSLKKKE